MSGSEKGSGRTVRRHHASRVKRNNQFSQVDGLFDGCPGDRDGVGLKSDEAGGVNMEDRAAALVVGLRIGLRVWLLHAFVVRVMHVTMIMAVNVDGRVVLGVGVGRKHVERAANTIVEVVRMARLGGSNARPGDRDGQDGRYDLAHQNHA